MRYLIMLKTPVPGVWQPAHVAYLQRAELEAFKGQQRRYYHETAVQVARDLYVYPLAEAEQLIEAMRRKMPFAQFFLFGYHGTI